MAVIESIGAVDASDPVVAREGLRALTTSPFISSAAVLLRAASLAETFTAEDARNHGENSLEAAETGLFAAMFSARGGDDEAAWQRADLVWNSDLGIDLVPALLPLLERLQRRKGARIAPAGVEEPQITLHFEQAGSFTVPMDITFVGDPPQGRALFLIRRKSELLALLKITMPPGSTVRGTQRVMATFNSEIDLSDAEVTLVFFDATACHCDRGPQDMDPRIWGLSSPVPPLP